MQKVTLGILAHVDSGKTTLSEGLLYASGALRKLGRVDHGDAFLDTDALERERGITIFSKQAMLFAGDKEFTLLDTPGHVDFSAEMERTLSVLDYAVLVISGSDGVQSHTRTLWRLLTRYEVPTFLFINKMDLAGADKDALLRQLTATLSAECVDFSASQETRDEALALCDEAALEQLLERGKIDDALISEMVKNRKVFPCFFGSALKLDGVEDFLTALACFTRERGEKVHHAVQLEEIIEKQAVQNSCLLSCLLPDTDRVIHNNHRQNKADGKFKASHSVPQRRRRCQRTYSG